MDLFMAISGGIGTSVATGVRAVLVPLLVGLLGRLNASVDFEHTAYSFLESVPWLIFLMSLIVGAWLLERGDIQLPDSVWVVVAMGMGAVLFAGMLEDENYFGIPGLFAGMTCALIGFAAARVFLGGAAERMRARGESPRTIIALGDLAALGTAALAVVVPPVSYVALGFCGWVLIARRRRAGEKYEGLRVLR